MSKTDQSSQPTCPRVDNNNFLNIVLCDNDYRQALQSSLSQVWEWYKAGQKHTPEQWKNYILAHLVSACMARMAVATMPIDWTRLKRLESYLVSRLHVTYTAHEPLLDHDGGSAYLNLHTGTIRCY